MDTRLSSVRYIIGNETTIKQADVLVSLWPIKLFIGLADELFGPITTIHQNWKVTKHLPRSSFTMDSADWEHVYDTCAIILVQWFAVLLAATNIILLLGR